MDLNHWPSGYEPDELPGCSTPLKDIFLFHSLIIQKNGEKSIRNNKASKINLNLKK